VVRPAALQRIWYAFYYGPNWWRSLHGPYWRIYGRVGNGLRLARNSRDAGPRLDSGTETEAVVNKIEGKPVQGYQSVEVGDRMRVQWVDVNIELGYIDFRKTRVN
jgi:hypothetical protein